jgi:hypothetical protein
MIRDAGGRPVLGQPLTVQRREVVGVGAYRDPALLSCPDRMGFVVTGIHPGIKARHHVDGMASQRRDQPVLCRSSSK